MNDVVHQSVVMVDQRFEYGADERLEASLAAHLERPDLIYNQPVHLAVSKTVILLTPTFHPY